MCNAYSFVRKAHVGTLADLPRALVASRFQNAQRLERAIENSLQSEDPFFALNNRVSQKGWAERLLLAAHAIGRSGDDAACANYPSFRFDAFIQAQEA